MIGVVTSGVVTGAGIIGSVFFTEGPAWWKWVTCASAIFGVSCLLLWLQDERRIADLRGQIEALATDVSARNILGVFADQGGFLLDEIRAIARGRLTEWDWSSEMERVRNWADTIDELVEDRLGPSYKDQLYSSVSAPGTAQSPPQGVAGEMGEVWLSVHRRVGWLSHFMERIKDRPSSSGL
jgi:hypothetical protein